MSTDAYEHELLRAAIRRCTPMVRECQPPRLGVQVLGVQVMSTPRPFGKRWGVGYSPGETDTVCGYFMNPDAPAVHLVRWCNEPATYGFRFKRGPEDDVFASMGQWNGACETHAAMVRQQDEAQEMWSLPRRAAS